MVDAARIAMTLVRDRKPEGLKSDVGLVLSLMKAIEIVGEAASKITADYRDAHTDVPWAEAVGMRNRLVHVYFDINRELLWKTVVEDLPLLTARLEDLLAAG
jgi:uncharacterized protein with HEPN domain